MTSGARSQADAIAGRRWRAGLRAACLAVALVLGSAAASAQDVAPYDDHLLRIAEILGALHHLRPLCGADEPQVWREQMAALIAAEQPSPDREKRLVDRFNRAYRDLAQTHRTCSASARALIERYTAEGAALVQETVTRWGRG